jgi:hypothetical protein
MCDGVEKGSRFAMVAEPALSSIDLCLLYVLRPTPCGVTACVLMRSTRKGIAEGGGEKRQLHHQSSVEFAP